MGHQTIVVSGDQMQKIQSALDDILNVAEKHKLSAVEMLAAISMLATDIRNTTGLEVAGFATFDKEGNELERQGEVTLPSGAGSKLVN